MDLNELDALITKLVMMRNKATVILDKKVSGIDLEDKQVDSIKVEYIAIHDEVLDKIATLQKGEFPITLPKEDNIVDILNEQAGVKNESSFYEDIDWD